MELHNVRWQIEQEVQRRLAEELHDSKLNKFFIFSVISFISVMIGFMIGKVNL